MISYDYSNKETNIYFPTDKTLIDTHTEIGDFSSYFYMMKFTPWIRRVLIVPSESLKSIENIIAMWLWVKIVVWRYN